MGLRTDLPSLQSLELGDYAFNDAPSFELIGLVERVKLKIDLPRLQSIRRGEDAILNTESFEISNHTSIQSFKYDSNYFSKVQSFELNGLVK